MALTKQALEMIGPYVRKAKVLCLGYPDVLVTPAEVFSLFGVEVHKVTSFGAGHKIKHGLADTLEVFGALGVESVFCVDIQPSRGVETVVDLNEVLWPARPHGTFDLVIDAGTIEHCANIGQALLNAANAVAPGGHVFHSPPVTMINHGFYNVCPTLLYDFYVQNDWQVKHLSAFHKSTFAPYPLPSATARYQMPAEHALYFLAQRPRHMDKLQWPKQTKYKTP